MAHKKGAMGEFTQNCEKHSNVPKTLHKASQLIEEVSYKFSCLYQSHLPNYKISKMTYEFCNEHGQWEMEIRFLMKTNKFRVNSVGIWDQICWQIYCKCSICPPSY